MGSEHSTPFGPLSILHSAPARKHTVVDIDGNNVEVLAISQGEFDKPWTLGRIVLQDSYDLILVFPVRNMAVLFRRKGTMLLQPVLKGTTYSVLVGWNILPPNCSPPGLMDLVKQVPEPEVARLFEGQGLK
jgi:hypothetical protein